MQIALVYMVAGLSSRFGGKIKQFARVGKNNETLIEYSLNQALPAGFTKIIFIVGNKTEAPFREMFRNEYKGIPVYYALQKFNPELRDKPWGTTDALCSAKPSLDCPFVVCNGDDIYGENTFKILINHLKNFETNATVGYKLKNVLPEQGKVNRAIFETDSENNLTKLKEILGIEKPNLEEKNLNSEDLCSMNIFALRPELVPLLKRILEEFKEKNKFNRRAECLLPENIGNLIQQKKIKMKLYTATDAWHGITNPEDEIKVKQELEKNK